MSFTIAIIGRPNVGKSTLFNKLAGRQLAIVNNTPGVTRDRKEAEGSIGPMEFKIIDTAGLEEETDAKRLEAKMLAQTKMAILDADLCLFVVDGRAGVNPVDMYFARWIHKENVKAILIANKCEGQMNSYIFDKEYYKLGFGEPIAISAEHKLGWGELYDAIEPFYDKYNEEFKELEVESNGVNLDTKIEDRAIQIAIVGRPNVGKSTLINKILGEERVITGPEAGTTRDSIVIDWEYKSKKIQLIDTAGVRKRMNIVDKLEKMSVSDTFHSIRFAHVVVLMIDSNSPLDKQDLAIASIVVKEGRGLLFCLNKWDTISDQKTLLKQIIQQIEKTVPNAAGVPIIPVSALTGKNLDELMDSCLKIYANWNKKISTAELNNWLKFISNEHTPPLHKGRTVKLKYITQIKIRPPTFALFTNNPDRLSQTNYERFVINSLRRDFDMQESIIRLYLRKTENPFDKKQKTKKLRNKLNTEKRKVRKKRIYDKNQFKGRKNKGKNRRNNK
jgi:GTPase